MHTPHPSPPCSTLWWVWAHLRPKLLTGGSVAANESKVQMAQHPHLTRKRIIRCIWESWPHPFQRTVGGTISPYLHSWIYCEQCGKALTLPCSHSTRETWVTTFRYGKNTFVIHCLYYWLLLQTAELLLIQELCYKHFRLANGTRTHTQTCMFAFESCYVLLHYNELKTLNTGNACANNHSPNIMAIFRQLPPRKWRSKWIQRMSGIWASLACATQVIGVKVVLHQQTVDNEWDMRLNQGG